eukprot:TRINITY_DN63467_c0_g1_i1.p1 TRINITY_DN63467_c0_g1~~TRINITY_DN63467_c0_g1_i1.p1  ORF type:complete len:494 (-),score=52.89 TRINITY_DN63467_c0_g1_i1:181-1593(-)
MASTDVSIAEGRRRVAVVGGGPAGAAICRFLVEVGHQPVVFEAGFEFGGIWAQKPTSEAVYRSLVTNIPTCVMQSFDLDFPSGLPSYIRAADLGRYLVHYAETFGLTRFVRFGARVTHVHSLLSEEAEEEQENTSIAPSWRVKWTSRSDSNSEEIEDEADFDAVVIATGHYSQPYCPEVLGQADWLSAAPMPGARTINHAYTYVEPSPFASRSVLVVGGRSSGVDISRELRGSASWVYVLEKSCQEVKTIGNCTHLPIGAKLLHDGYISVAGATVPGLPVDDVMLATGYEYGFSVLDAAGLRLDYGPDRRYVSPLYMHTVHAQRPSLCFAGIPLAIPCPVPIFEAQARFIASHLLCGCHQPTAVKSSRKQREAWVASRFVEVGARTQDMHFLGDASWEYMRELVRLSGMAGPAYKTYCHRLALVEAVFRDRKSRMPTMPWDDDCYRQCEYSVDWEAGTFEVKLPSEPQSG